MIGSVNASDPARDGGQQPPRQASRQAAGTWNNSLASASQPSAHTGHQQPQQAVMNRHHGPVPASVTGASVMGEGWSPLDVVPAVLGVGGAIGLSINNALQALPGAMGAAGALMERYRTPPLQVPEATTGLRAALDFRRNIPLDTSPASAFVGSGSPAPRSPRGTVPQAGGGQRPPQPPGNVAMPPYLANGQQPSTHDRKEVDRWAKEFERRIGGDLVGARTDDIRRELLEQAERESGLLVRMQVERAITPFQGGPTNGRSTTPVNSAPASAGRPGDVAEGAGITGPDTPAGADAANAAGTPPAFRTLEEAVEQLETLGITLDPHLGYGDASIEARHRALSPPMKQHSTESLLSILNAIMPAVTRLDGNWPGLLNGLKISTWEVAQRAPVEDGKLLYVATAQNFRRTVAFAAAPLLAQRASAEHVSVEQMIEGDFLHEVGHFTWSKTSHVMQLAMHGAYVPIGIIDPSREPAPDFPGTYSSWENFTERHGLGNISKGEAGVRATYLYGFGLDKPQLLMRRIGGNMAEIGGSLSGYPVSGIAADGNEEAIAELLAHYLRATGPRYDLDSQLPLPFNTSQDATGLRRTHRGLTLNVYLTLLDAMHAEPAADGVNFQHDRGNLPSTDVIRRLPYSAP